MFQEVRSVSFDVTSYDQVPLPAVPITLLTAERSPAAARAMVQALHRRHPATALIELRGTGHMAPLTHPAKVSEALLDHARRVGVAD